MNGSGRRLAAKTIDLALKALGVCSAPAKQDVQTDATASTAQATVPQQNCAPMTADQARATLREVRYTINDFRDSTWAALVRQRNHLTETAIFARVYTYFFLAFAVILGVPPHTIIAAASFYIIGALVGFVSRLRSGPQSDSPVQDYGLASARLVQTPAFSGLAAVGGVLATIALSTAVNGTVLTGQSTLTHQLADVFNIQKSPFNLIIAAIFGLAPDRFFDRLQTLANQYKNDIGSSEPSGGSQPGQGNSAQNV